MNKIGGTVLKVNVAVAIITYIWIHNVAFDIPIFTWTDVYTYIVGESMLHICHPENDPIFVIVAPIVNFYVPLTIMWTSNIGIIYKLKRIINKVILFYLFLSKFVRTGPLVL